MSEKSEDSSAKVTQEAFERALASILGSESLDWVRPEISRMEAEDTEICGPRRDIGPRNECS